jgi:ABC-2 type transport system permease protein
MKHAPTIAMRELRSMFVSPVAYAVLSLFAVLSGVFFVLSVAAYNMQTVQYRQFQAFEQLERMNLNDWLIAGFYQSMAFIMVFLIPAVTMGLFVSEKTNGTQELLMTSPITVWDIVLGKFAAAAIFVGLLVAMVGAYPGLLFVYGDPELGKTLTGLLGVLLVGWTYVSIGVFASSVTRSQVVSFLVAMVLLLVMMLAPAMAGLGVVAGVEGVDEIFRWLSSEEHSMKLMEGLVDTADIAYFAVVIGSFLLMTRAAVESVRWR